MTDIKEYGRALFSLADEEGRADAVREDVLSLLGALRDNPSYARLLDSAALSKDERLGLIDEALASLDSYLVNLVKILTERHLVLSLREALLGFLSVYDDSRGIERVEVVSVIPLTEAQIEALTRRLESEGGKRVIIRNTIDSTILGGVKLRYAGKQLDGSLKTRLDSLEERLKDILI